MTQVGSSRILYNLFKKKLYNLIENRNPNRLVTPKSSFEIVQEARLVWSFNR